MPNGCQTCYQNIFVAAVIFVSIIETISYVSAYKIKGFINFSLTGIWKCGTDLIKTFGMTWNSGWIQDKSQLLYIPLQKLRNQQLLDHEVSRATKF